ncbi:cache domain-containing sensor histidine kinase [Gracilibacillus dipsosauri]|uniref:Sensor histidine kinase n=1 Tax=Gracilibacillus dipsosauri TaxID=178340 RepID=A0A317KX80_9BACI|nr:sensor histidine kinase [Gracilibacillus dipsosauri]PWU68085.1 sensor histidine kinase [Gracilibacillus dipsosauri]
MKKWTQINNIPIRYKLITHFLLVGILPILCLGLLVSWTVERVLEEQANDNTMQLISKVNQTFEFYINNMQSITYMIASDNEIQQFFDSPDGAENKYELQRYLRSFTTITSEVAGIMVVNKDGEYISNELYAPSVIDLTQSFWYQEAVESDGIFHIIGRPDGRRLISIVDYKNEDVVSVVRAVMDPFTKEVKGVILIDLKLRVIAETARDIQLGKSGYLMVVDNKGKNIYLPNQPIVKDIPLDWIHRQASGNFSKTINKEKIQFIYQRSPFADWTTVGVFPAEETLFELREIRFYLIVFIFIIMLFGIPVSYYLSRSISKPIVDLMKFMRRAESGDLHVRYKEKREDEIGLLGRSFNTMLQKVLELMRVTERQERQKRDAEFRSLQANINPHFLYNTLDTIQWMARKQNVIDVAEVVESLAKLFRIGLSKGRDIITVSAEMEHIESYLKIQKTRYRDKLNYQMNIDPQVRSFYTLKFILQPIVENAIYHGIKERRGPGTVLINASIARDDLLIIIEDNGAGMTIEQLHDMKQALAEAMQRTEKVEDGHKKKGYGILNVQARIQLTYGEKYGLSIDSEKAKGTRVEILLPVIREQYSEKGKSS